MSTIGLTAGEIMRRVGALLNDPNLTDYTYVAQLIYLQMAVDELTESLEESNSPSTNETHSPITIKVGVNQIAPPNLLMEIQEIGEREAGTNDGFVFMTRRENLDMYPATNSLGYWVWESNLIKFNPNGATSVREIQIKYVRQPLRAPVDEDSIIPVINGRSYLSYKTAALCARFIGENETRADALETKAETALERLLTIENKGRQQIMTRHRPFRAAYKARGGM